MTANRKTVSRTTKAADRIVLGMPPDPRWLSLAGDACLRFCQAQEFGPELTDMLVQSVDEACEEIIRVAEKHGYHEHIELVLYHDHLAVVADLVYSGHLPLDPRQSQEYEMPSGPGLDAVDPDSLWLHLIKHRMDRVFFRVDAGRRILRMVKYRREPGREKDEWIMGLKPKLGQTVVVCVPGPGETEEQCLVEDTRTGKVVRLTPAEVAVVNRLDGTRSFHDIAIETARHAGGLRLDTLIALYEDLKSAGMLDDEETAEPTRVGRLVKLLTPQLSLREPDVAAGAVHRRLRWLSGWPGAAFLALVALSGIVPLMRDYARFAEFASDIDLHFWASPWAALIVYALFMTMSALRECARALACKHFGGRITAMGVMFYGPAFVFYCDITASGALPGHAKRIMAGLSGTLALAATLGAAMWGWDSAASNLMKTAMCLFTLLCLGALMVNLNPFVRLDFYRMLTGVTGIPDLRRRSFAYLKYRIMRFTGLGDLAPAVEHPGPERVRLYLAYGLTGLVVTVVGMIMPTIRFAHVLLEDSPHSAQLFMATVSFVLVLTRLARQALRHVQSLRHREYNLK